MSWALKRIGVLALLWVGFGAGRLLGLGLSERPGHAQVGPRAESAIGERSAASLQAPTPPGPAGAELDVASAPRADAASAPPTGAGTAPVGGLRGHVVLPAEMPFLQPWVLLGRGSSVSAIELVDRAPVSESVRFDFGEPEPTGLWWGFSDAASPSEENPDELHWVRAVRASELQGGAVLEFPAEVTRLGVRVRLLDSAGRGVTALPEMGWSLVQGRGARGTSGGQLARIPGGFACRPPEASSHRPWPGLLERGELAADELVRLAVAVPGLGTQDVEVAWGAQPVTIQFAASCGLEVEIEDFERTAGGRAFKVEVVTDSRHQPFLSPDAQAPNAVGRLSFRGLQPGGYTVKLGLENSSGTGTSTRYRATRRVVLTSGTQQVRVPSPVEHGFSAAVRGVEPGARIVLRGVSAEGSNGQVAVGEVDATSRVEFGEVWAGEYLATVGGGDLGGLAVTVPGGVELLDFGPGGALRVLDLGPGSSLRGRLRAGDLIIEVDGAAPPMTTSLGPLFDPLTVGGDRTEWVLLRGGRRVELEIELEAGSFAWAPVQVFPVARPE